MKKAVRKIANGFINGVVQLGLAAAIFFGLAIVIGYIISDESPNWFKIAYIILAAGVIVSYICAEFIKEEAETNGNETK